MSFEDFVQYFDSVTICMLSADVSASICGIVRPNAAQDGRPWVDTRRKGVVELDKFDNSIQATCFSFSVPSGQSGDVWFSIHQPDTRNPSHKPYIDLGVALLREKPDGSYELQASTGVGCSRELYIKCRALAGNYVVVPLTTGCKMMQDASDGSTNPPLYDEETEQFTTEVQSALRVAFKQLDTDMDHLLRGEELYRCVELLNYNSTWDDTNECAEYLLGFDSCDDGLTLDGFCEAFLALFKWNDCDETMVRHAAGLWIHLTSISLAMQLMHQLGALGFDEDLDLAYTRHFVIAAHSTFVPDFKARAFDADLFDEAMEQTLVQAGRYAPLSIGTLGVVHSS